MLFLIAAGMLMHGARLKMKWDFEGWSDYLESATGVAIEGVFLLLLSSGAFSLGRRLYSRLDDVPPLAAFVATSLFIAVSDSSTLCCPRYWETPCSGPRT